MSRLFLFFVRRSWAANIICEGESVDSILASDKIILAAPIYSWSCPAPMKALLDRLVYEGMPSERDLGYNSGFISDNKTDRARAFAKNLLNRC